MTEGTAAVVEMMTTAAEKGITKATDTTIHAANEDISRFGYNIWFVGWVLLSFQYLFMFCLPGKRGVISATFIFISKHIVFDTGKREYFARNRICLQSASHPSDKYSGDRQTWEPPLGPRKLIQKVNHQRTMAATSNSLGQTSGPLRLGFYLSYPARKFCLVCIPRSVNFSNHVF